MSEQTETSWSIPITEAELKFLCSALGAYLDRQCDLIEEETLEALDAYSQEELDIVRDFLQKAIHAEELEYGKGSEMNLLKFNIFKLMTAVDRAVALRSERLEDLLPE